MVGQLFRRDEQTRPSFRPARANGGGLSPNSETAATPNEPDPHGKVRLKAWVRLGVPPLGGKAQGYALAGEDSAPGRLKAELHTIRNSTDSSNRTPHGTTRPRSTGRRDCQSAGQPDGPGGVHLSNLDCDGIDLPGGKEKAALVCVAPTRRPGGCGDGAGLDVVICGAE